MIQRYLDAMALIEAISAGLRTASHIWGGWTLDIYQGRPLRAHGDIDCFVINLHQCFASVSGRLLEEGWEVRNLLDSHLLWAKKEEVKLHLGHVEIDDDVVNWKHNGNDGSILFPVAWLREHPIEFLDTRVHVVEPEFGYVLKTNPYLMNPDWEPRDKDQADIDLLRKVLLEKQIDLNSLLPRVKSVSCPVTST